MLRAGGMCVLARDGFFSVCWGSLALGLVLGGVYCYYLPRLMALPLDVWRAGGSGSEAEDPGASRRGELGGGGSKRA